MFSKAKHHLTNVSNGMIVYPNAKINIGLNIVERRNDGYHNISTLFYPIKDLRDILEITIANKRSEPLEFKQTGIAIDCPAESNLCIKAHRLISEICPLPPIKMHLHKIIPTGAGLGGGSSNGAFALKAINELAGEPLTEQQLSELALELGSDCPFFVVNKPCIGKGRGEVLEPFNVDLSGFHILLVNPGIHVNTGKAYSLSKPEPWSIPLDFLLNENVYNWKGSIANDFEKVVFEQHPEIKKIKHTMYELGAIYASMSGSGSTVFGLFKSEPNFTTLYEEYFTKITKL